MRIQPLHQLFAHGGIVETSLRKIKDNKKGKAGIQCPVVVGIIMKGLWSVHRFLSRGSARSSGTGGVTHRRFPPAIHNELNIIYGMLDQYLGGLFITPSETALACSSQHMRKRPRTIGDLAPFGCF